MTATSKPLWGEGQFLRPQHFQRQDAYHEWRAAETARVLHPYAWGVRHLRVDTDALSSNQLRVIELQAVLPDGEIINAPTEDELPPAMSLAGLGAGVSEVVWSVAMAPLRPSGANHAPGPNEAAVSGQRYLQQAQQAPDWFTGADTAELMVLRRNLRLVPAGEPLDQLVSLPILRLRRQGTGGFELDTRFVAPSTQVAAAPALQALLRRLLDALQAKVEALVGVHREPSRHIVEFRSGDTASFWLLHTASQAFASLSHLHHHAGLHPERLYQDLLRLAGGLLTFSKRYGLADLPAYSHEAPERCFTDLESMIRELLDTVISTRYFSIALSEVKTSFHHGRLESERITPKTRLVLGVKSGLGLAELVKVLPQRIKIGSPTDVDKIAMFATPGVRTAHTPQVPTAIPVRPEHAYFVLESTGPLYERMLQSQTIAIHLPSSGPNGIPEVVMELFALND